MAQHVQLQWPLEAGKFGLETERCSLWLPAVAAACGCWLWGLLAVAGSTTWSASVPGVCHGH